jgi:hypothetical protein
LSPQLGAHQLISPVVSDVQYKGYTNTTTSLALHSKGSRGVTRHKSTFGEMYRERVARYILAHGNEPDDDYTEQIIEEFIESPTDPSPELTTAIVESAKSNAHARRQGLADSLNIQERSSLKSYQAFVDVAHELHRRLVTAFLEWSPETRETSFHDIVDKQAIKPIMLLSLHSRGCAISAEIEHLYLARYFDASRSRVRTLYESSVIGCVLAVAPSDLSARYYASGMLERRADLRTMLSSNKELGWSEPAQEEVAEVEAHCDALLEAYGDSIRLPLGWARPLFANRGEGARVTFADIEEYVGDLYRIVYKMLNHSVHSGPSITAQHLVYEPSTGPIEHSSVITDTNLILGGASAFMLHLSEVVCRHVVSVTAALDEMLALRLLTARKRRLDKELSA